jgi:hypothetical protein
VSWGLKLNWYVIITKLAEVLPKTLVVCRFEAVTALGLYFSGSHFTFFWHIFIPLCDHSLYSYITE